MNILRVFGLLLCAAAPAFSQTSVEVFGAELWSTRPFADTSFVVSLPKGGNARLRDVPKPPDGSSAVGQDLTLDDAWTDIIRLQHVVGRDPISLDAGRKPWGKPMEKTRHGMRTLEVGYDDAEGGTIAEVHYIVKMGPKKFLELLLRCRKDSVPRYAPYFARIRDSLRPAKPSGTGNSTKDKTGKTKR